VVGPEEQRLLFGAFKLFAHTLSAERPCPTNPNDRHRGRSR
jgi:hypothetical protein